MSIAANEFQLATRINAAELFVCILIECIEILAQCMNSEIKLLFDFQ